MNVNVWRHSGPAFQLVRIENDTRVSSETPWCWTRHILTNCAKFAHFLEVKGNFFLVLVWFYFVFPSLFSYHSTHQGAATPWKSSKEKESMHLSRIRATKDQQRWTASWIADHTHPGCHLSCLKTKNTIIIYISLVEKRLYLFKPQTWRWGSERWTCHLQKSAVYVNNVLDSSLCCPVWPEIGYCSCNFRT